MPEFDYYGATERVEEDIAELVKEFKKRRTSAVPVVETDRMHNDRIWTITFRVTGNNRTVRAKIRQGVSLGRTIPEDYAQPHISFSDLSDLAKHTSRMHAAIYIRRAYIAIQDLGSTNGTYLNGNKLEAFTDYKLGRHDMIQLGRMELQVEELEPLDG